MAAKEPKKLAIIYILKALENYSSKNCTYSQQRIIELVYDKYGMKLDRKTVRHNLSKLLEAGFPLEHEEFTRTNTKGQTETILTNWYYDHESEWDISELRMMIDSIAFSNYLPKRQCSNIIKKIAALGDEDTKQKLKTASETISRLRPENKSIFFNVSELSEAIHSNEMVSFNYCDYDIDFKLHPRLDDKGRPKLYTLSPYKLVSLNGRYYVLGYYDKHDEICTFRIDRIANIRKLDEKSKHIRSVKGFENGIDLEEYTAQHPNMWGGEPVRCTFCCPRYIMDDIVDWFGSDAVIREIEDRRLEVSVRVSEGTMKHWAMQYADCVEVISPKQLREEVAEIMRAAAERYG